MLGRVSLATVSVFYTHIRPHSLSFTYTINKVLVPALVEIQAAVVVLNKRGWVGYLLPHPTEAKLYCHFHRQEHMDGELQGVGVVLCAQHCIGHTFGDIDTSRVLLKTSRGSTRPLRDVTFPKVYPSPCQNARHLFKFVSYSCCFSHLRAKTSSDLCQDYGTCCTSCPRTYFLYFSPSRSPTDPLAAAGEDAEVGPY